MDEVRESSRTKPPRVYSEPVKEIRKKDNSKVSEAKPGYPQSDQPKITLDLYDDEESDLPSGRRFQENRRKGDRKMAGALIKTKSGLIRPLSGYVRTQKTTSSLLGGTPGFKEFESKPTRLRAMPIIPKRSKTLEFSVSQIGPNLTRKHHLLPLQLTSSKTSISAENKSRSGRKTQEEIVAKTRTSEPTVELPDVSRIIQETTVSVIKELEERGMLNIVRTPNGDHLPPLSTTKRSIRLPGLRPNIPPKATIAIVESLHMPNSVAKKRKSVNLIGYTTPIVLAGGGITMPQTTTDVQLVEEQENENNGDIESEPEAQHEDHDNNESDDETNDYGEIDNVSLPSREEDQLQDSYSEQSDDDHIPKMRGFDSPSTATITPDLAMYDSHDEDLSKYHNDWRLNKGMLDCLEYLCQKELMADVHFVFPEKKRVRIPAHSFVFCARSPEFESMLKSTDKENNPKEKSPKDKSSQQSSQRGNSQPTQKEIVIEDMSSAAFRILLHYVYTDTVNLDNAHVSEILEAAKKYYLPGLASMCADVLEGEVSLENVCIVFNRAVVFQMDSLKAKCMDFINKNATAVFQMKNFLDISKEALGVILDSRELNVVEELETFRNAMKWAKNKCEQEKLSKTAENMRNVLGDLAKKCTDLLANALTTDNVCAVYNEAKQYEMNRLSEKCMEYINNNAIDFFESNDFLGLNVDSLASIFASDELVVRSELDVFRAGLRWANNQCNIKNWKATPQKLRSVLGKAFFEIRLPVTPLHEFSNHVEESGILFPKEQEEIYKFMYTNEKEKASVKDQNEENSKNSNKKKDKKTNGKDKTRKAGKAEKNKTSSKDKKQMDNKSKVKPKTGKEQTKMEEETPLVEGFKIKERIGSDIEVDILSGEDSFPNLSPYFFPDTNSEYKSEVIVTTDKKIALYKLVLLTEGTWFVEVLLNDDILYHFQRISAPEIEMDVHGKLAADFKNVLCVRVKILRQKSELPKLDSLPEIVYSNYVKGCNIKIEGEMLFIQSLHFKRL
ncbi:hypothetical protein CHS0354_020151 [Potamilus streckersoni]|uniref:BTB domain-containing protein n=1 Tax=Potamilus streckersoni TaxID=2493646 RepID=A0AAE0VP57_9BIVA|nr:hypothetical protein CHS0354_020151 [Potamilus streckersoni]